MSRKWVKVAAALTVLIAAIGFWSWSRGQCLSVRFKHGLVIPRCPDGEFRQVVQINTDGLRRGAKASVSVSARALYTTGAADGLESAAFDDFKVRLSILDKDGKATPLVAIKGWKQSGDNRRAMVELPAVPDGDYKLRADVTTSIGKKEVEMPLPLYAPAQIHVLTDRPLYEPGNTVQFRAVVLRANDLTPIDHRPGKWIVKDPNGVVLLQEQAPAADWGVISGSFPLDSEAANGLWSVVWESGRDTGEQSFTVEPFTLPRFSVEAAPKRPYYKAAEKPVVEGTVTYSSGAPVANAKVKITWSQGPEAWPAPPVWLRDGLPKDATTDRAGLFTLNLPEIPTDLRGKKTLVARIAAVDATGDRVEGRASVLLSEDAVAVSAVTELGGGLVQGANNRVYLRVTTPDGQALPGASISVKKAWAPRDKPVEAKLDLDSVARLQLDPGAPVNIVIPPMPVRRALKEVNEDALVSRTKDYDLFEQAVVSLGDQAVLDKWTPVLEDCTRFVGDETVTVRVVATVAPSGQISKVSGGDLPADACVKRIVRSRRLAAGKARLVLLGWALEDPGLPLLEVEIEGGFGEASDEVETELTTAAIKARACLPKNVDGALARPMIYEQAEGKKNIVLKWVRGADDPEGVKVSPGIQRCIDSALRGLATEEPAESSEIGVVRLAIESGAEEEGTSEQRKPQPTIMRGYEMQVAVKMGETEIGTTLLRVSPGQVPDLRIRASEVLASAGDQIELKLIRGPNFSGTIPKKMQVRHRGDVKTVDIDKEKRVAAFTIPTDGHGWYEFLAVGQRALVFVESSDQLAVSVGAAKSRYAPGADAELAITTKIGGKGAPAAVGLFGVDATMAQLAPLPGADAMNGMRPMVTMDEKVFGLLDGQALVSGRVRGTAAAEAVVLRVGTIPLPEETDVAVYDSAESHFDPVEELTTRFYDVLAELHRQTRAWEKSAKQGVQMVPKQMAKLWNAALDAVSKKGGNINDAFGRRMKLHRLPEDLLAMTSPRAVVADATRLPEDVENWTQWVRSKRP